MDGIAAFSQTRTHGLKALAGTSVAPAENLRYTPTMAMYEAHLVKPLQGLQHAPFPIVALDKNGAGRVFYEGGDGLGKRLWLQKQR